MVAVIEACKTIDTFIPGPQIPHPHRMQYINAFDVARHLNAPAYGSFFLRTPSTSSICRRKAIPGLQDGVHVTRLPLERARVLYCPTSFHNGCQYLGSASDAPLEILKCSFKCSLWEERVKGGQGVPCLPRRSSSVDLKVE